MAEIENDAWEELLPKGDPAPILRRAWLAALEESGCASPRTGWEPCHLAAFRGRRLVGLAVAWKKFHSLGEYIYDFGWADAAQRAGLAYYPKFLVGVPLSPITSPRFLVHPTEDARQMRVFLADAAVQAARDNHCSSVHVLFSPDDEAQALCGTGFFPRLSMQFHWRNSNYRTYADFLARFDSKRRHQLRRERDEVANAGIEVRTIAGADLLPVHAELAWKFYQHTANRHAWGPIQLNAKFFRQVFASMPDAVELVTASRGAEIVAGAFNLRTPSRLYGRYWGAFVDVPFLHFAVCFYHSIEQCILAGRQVFEPGAGGEHKIVRGFEPSAIQSSHLIFHPALGAAVERACRGEAAQIETIVADGAAHSGYKR